MSEEVLYSRYTIRSDDGYTPLGFKGLFHPKSKFIQNKIYDLYKERLKIGDLHVKGGCKYRITRITKDGIYGIPIIESTTNPEHENTLDEIARNFSPSSKLYFACLSCAWFNDGCSGQYSDEVCNKFIAVGSKEEHYRNFIENEPSCPNCGSTNLKGIYGDRFRCQKCGRIFS